MEIAARFEFKFVLPLAGRDALLARFADRFQADTLGSPDGRYPVVSLYCDTPDRRCYWEAWRGVPSRRKLRLRLYGTRDGSIPPATFVEIKQRDGRDGAKRRVALPLAEAVALADHGRLPAGRDAADTRILEEAGRLVADEGFRPACVIRYDRQAFRFTDAAGREQLRVTFDQGIRCRFEDLSPAAADDRCLRPVLAESLCLMEVKGAEAVPHDFAAHLSARGIFPRSFSKYSESVRLHGVTPALSVR
jgi:hypothetical protein